MAKVTLETFYQEFKDNQKYLISTLEEIKKQVKYTNGRVNSHDTSIALLKSDVCKLEEINNNEMVNGYKNKSFWISIISISLAILTFLLKIRDII